MPDLEERFRSLSRAPAPDLWDEVEVRPPRPLPPSPRGPRVIAGATALLVAVAGFAVAVSAFRGEDRRTAREVTAPPLVANGAIAVALGPDEDIFLIDPETGASTLAVDRHGAGFEGSLEMAWSPDGSMLAYTDLDDGDFLGLLVLDLATGDVRDLTQGLLQAHSPTWSPDGSQIAFTGIGFPAGYEIYVIAPDGSGLRRVTDEPNDGVSGSHMPAWSPDGARIAFNWNLYDGATETERSGIGVVDASGGDGSRLTDTDAVDETPAWSPDGTKIAFTRKLNGLPDVHLVNADGSGERRITGNGTDLPSAWTPDWSPSGSQLVFGSWAPGTSGLGIVIMDVVSGDTRTLLGGVSVVSAAWAPDGSRIAFVRQDDGGSMSIGTTTPDGSDLIEVAHELEGFGDIEWQPLAVPTSETPGAPTSAEIVDTIRVGEDVRSVAYGEGSAWVAVSNNDGSFAGRILRIDPETDAVQADIPVDVIPTWEVGGGAMVVSDGSVWVTGGLDQPGDFEDPGGGVDAAVIEIDAETEQVVRTIELGGDVGADLAFLDGDLWVLVFGDETVNHSMEVVRIDPVSGAILARIPLTASWAHTMVSASGRLVVIEGGDDAVNVDGHFAVIDPATDAVAERIPIESDFSAHGPVVWKDQVWAWIHDGFSRFDPIRGTVVDARPLDPTRFAMCCEVLEADDRGIWFLGNDGRTGGDERFLDLFDPETGDVEELLELTRDGTPVAMAVAPDSVWILNYEGTLTHIALS